jgi:peptidoglycan/xylan/chitin deacetylase (PgdA/CDA1 family)
MYHRVAAVPFDPWRLCVHPDRFDAHVRALQAFADVVPLECLQSSLRVGRRSRPVIAMTFDDGYVDNLTQAKPVLAARGVPATVFIATGYIGSGRAFWWDALAGLTLPAEPLPSRLNLDAAGMTFTWDDARLERRGGEGAKARRRLHDALWQWLVSLGDLPRRAALDDLSRWAGREIVSDPDALPMSTQQVRRLLQGGVVSVGAHTVTHARLTGLEPEQKFAEIEQSRLACAELTGRLPACFSYPFGEFDDESAACLRETGFEVACTSDPELVWQHGDVMRMPRIGVGDWSAENLLRLLNWYWFA